ncbi:Fungal specific transcription factor domain-containing protein [Cladophialophora immunda]|nr:Fungal specific transcription factor domain-containing protein [Cladophialophora immunda]
MQGSDISTDDRERYENYPQLYKPDPKGNPLRTSVICDFLQSRQAWAKVDEFGQSRKNRTNITIPEEVRDSIMATIHIVLAKVLDKDQMGKIPTTFPPLRTVQVIFETYLSRLAGFYPITHPGTFSHNHTMQYSGPGMQLQLLSTFVSGALMIPVTEVQTFATDLASIVLQVLYEIFLRDANQTKDIYLTSTAILITAFGIWSGNKRQMELAEALRSSYTTMMSRRGLHERAQQRIFKINLANIELEWRDWLMKETRRRLAYVWYVVEQEISLFNGVPTTLSFTEMRCPMPSNEALFAASSDEAWRDQVQVAQSGLSTPTSSTVAALKCPHSLAAFHRRFLSGNIFQFQDAVTPFEVRLLLCSIQTLVSQYSQTKRFVPEEEEFIPETCAISASSEYGQLRREELHYLLVKWHLLYRRVMPHTAPISCGTDLSCILMAHLIAMELYVSFDDVQLFAGKEGFVEGRMLMPSFKRWAKTSGAARALLHAGQIMHTLTIVAEDTARPLWWPLAVARAALLLWAYGMAAQTGADNTDAHDCTSGPSLFASELRSTKQNRGLDAIDGPLEDSALFSGSLIGFWDKEKVPCLTEPHGGLIPLLQISETLELSISLLRNGESVSTPLCRSVRTFLQDIQGLGVTYPGLPKVGMAMQQQQRTDVSTES